MFRNGRTAPPTPERPGPEARIAALTPYHAIATFNHILSYIYD